MSNILENRYDFVYLFDVLNGNPNGDPDAGNAPRMDPETGHGFVSDVCLKRKIRDFVILAKNLETGFDIWVKTKSLTLNEQIERAYHESDKVKEAVEAWTAWKKDKKKRSKPTKHYEDVAREWMCAQFFDIRTFGGVLMTADKSNDESTDQSKIKKTAGQVRGPVQLTFSTSVDTITPLEQALTVCAARKADKPVEAQIGIQGRKTIVPYALYRGHGFISPQLAAQTGFTIEDLALLKQSLAMMFEHDRSAARGQMSPQRCIAFRHESPLGNAQAHRLFERIKIVRKDDNKPPRAFSDYEVAIDTSNLQSGITVEEWV